MLPAPFTYQKYARQKVVTRKRTAVIAPPGSGKTRPIVEGVNDLGGFEGPVLVVCSGPAIATWVRQIPLWTQCDEYADFIRVVRGNRGDRIDLWEQAAEENYGTFITNFSIFYRDYAFIRKCKWKVVIADEYHKTMRNHKIDTKDKKTGRRRLKTYGMFKQMTRHTEILVLATGSLVRRNASSMFTAFQLVNPFLWSSYWRFVNTFCFVDDSHFGKQIHGVKNAKQLRKVMDEHFAYIPPEVVADSLPEGRRYAVDVELTKEQWKIYKEIDEEMLAIIGDTVVVTPTILSKLVKLRQLIVCPRILDESLGMGANFESIVDRLDNDNHVAIFVPFRPAVDHTVKELRRLGWKNTYGLYGGVGHAEQTEILGHVKATRGILVCTIQYAESFDLETCKTSYFNGYDLTVDQNEQAEGRTRRAISEHEFVTWGYMKTNTSVDQHFLDKLGSDADNARLILQRPDEYIRMLLQETRS